MNILLFTIIIAVLELKKTLNETQDTLAQEKNFSQQYKHERDQAVREHNQTKRERDQAVKICDQTKKERDQAVKECDQTKRERDQAVREHNQTKKERDQAVKECDQTKRERDQAVREHDQTKRERDQAVMEHHQTKKELEALREEHSRCRALWIVPRHHVMVTEKILGGGAWGYVKEGKFSGQQVAVKCVHEAIINQHTMKRVYREICTMSQVHHPNLVLFIAAVLDDKGGPMIITELLDTTLRKAYEDNLLKPGLDQCVAILRDVASALCYLHELEAPIIHRDVSSSNVLLQGLAKDKWKAKLSDFGSANWAKEASTMGEGAIVYTAPEAFPTHPSLDAKPPPQTTKIDVYSYGILLCEITLREFPNPATLHEMMAKMKARGASLHSMMQKCILKEPTQRPTMAKILQDLNEIGFTLNSQM